MTLHWWMHWFWITLLTTLAGNKLVQCAPQSEELQHLTTDVDQNHQYSDRQGRAMYFTKSQGIVTSTVRPALPKNTSADDGKLQDSKPMSNLTTISNLTDVVNITTSEVTKISVQWTPVNVSNVNLNITKTVKQAKNITQLSNETTISNSTPRTENSTPPTTKKRNNLTRHPDVVKDVETNLEGASESRIVTEKPLSLETAYLQTRIPETVESSRRVVEQNFDEAGMNSGAIAGISFAALVLAALAGSTAFVLYRRRYLNKPQTLNDKCSNPDSSGYLDDSTIRDNSEEMYSLDNDSFLNSLEAMTIQNYWTDTVKHTKL